MKKCKKCGAPLEGFLYKTIGKLMGLKPSDNDPELCNKCTEDQKETVSAQPAETAPITPEVNIPEVNQPEVKIETPTETEKKEDFTS